MNLPKYFTTSLTLALFSLTLTGCQTHRTTLPLSNGYEEVSHPNHTLIDEPAPARISLQYRAADNTVTPVWPSLYGGNEIIKGNLALFVADKAFIEPERVTHPRLFGVLAPALPMDLTEEVLWRWAKANGKNFGKTMEKFSSMAIEESRGKLAVRLEFWVEGEITPGRDDWPAESSLLLDWSQVDTITRAVKAKGVTQKDLRWHTPYIGEKY